ncbi:hypothetical protein H7I77_10005 [Mycolicibacterium novocastrense]|uniref:Uncharacterized protein n=1 Tax=Mycolicibacterium novocastrense TaxID=59813 RepID=A0AAW5SKD8_MYCNV|nr:MULTISPECIES: hypothetical protein [Mycolicibacterium]MCV7023679.1 hypothetical protein [Mycolicibacterium novocastrense]MDX1886916.1 hypothetical protein [Mycolicibacterium sp. 120270]GAT07675.1 uncharacterized protein RMCN_0808 [Mycolicibacterium novocastrense]
MSRRPSKRQLEALELVAASRVQYGAEYPERSRRAAKRGHTIVPTFLIDGVAPYGSGHTTWSAVESRGWIVVRHDEVPKHSVAEQVRTYSTVTGFKTTTIPAHEEPIGSSWAGRYCSATC